LFCFDKNNWKFRKTRAEFLKKFSPFKNVKVSFGLIAFLLFFTTCSACDKLAKLNGFETTHLVFFNALFDQEKIKSKDGFFVSQSEAMQLETPDLKIIQDNTLGGVATPHIVSTKVLGDVFGGNSKNNKVITEYAVQAGDTIQSVSEEFGISANTLIWANDMTTSSKLKVGQSLVILPTDGVLHIVKSGDTLIDIAKKYSTKEEDIITFNDLAGQEDVYIGDILIIPSGRIPKSSSSSISASQKTTIASNYFIFPTFGVITQGLHFYNAIDVANKCGTGIYAAASGTVQRVKYGYNAGGGNVITILHPNGTVTYYGHLQTIFVKSGDKVNIGDRIGLMGNTGYVIGATGCHLHFQVIGAKNPLSVYSVGSSIKMK